MPAALKTQRSLYRRYGTSTTTFFTQSLSTLHDSPDEPATKGEKGEHDYDPEPGEIAAIVIVVAGPVIVRVVPHALVPIPRDALGVALAVAAAVRAALIPIAIASVAQIPGRVPVVNCCAA